MAHVLLPMMAAIYRFPNGVANRAMYLNHAHIPKRKLLKVSAFDQTLYSD
jgi:hypothetical protein